MIIFAEYSNKETFLMLKLQTPVADSACRAGISYNDKIMMLGSCFADNIGQYLVNYGFDVCVNPFGTLYNPESISRSSSQKKNVYRWAADRSCSAHSAIIRHLQERLWPSSSPMQTTRLPMLRNSTTTATK